MKMETKIIIKDDKIECFYIHTNEIRTPAHVDLLIDTLVDLRKILVRNQTKENTQ